MSLRNESGSAAPLAIGLALLALTMIMATSLASSMFLFQRRLAALADSTAISVRRELVEPAATNPNAPLMRLVENRMFLLQSAKGSPLAGLAAESAAMKDGQTLEINLCATWQAPFTVAFLPSQATVCSRSAARPIN
jgi:hypothetical protein